MIGATFPNDFMKDILEWVKDFDRNKLIVCSHYPPHLLRDLTQAGAHVGVKEFRDLIIKLKPALWMCGHIHEDSGKTKFLKTTVLNATVCDVNYKPVRAGYSVEITDKGVKIDEVKL